VRGSAIAIMALTVSACAGPGPHTRAGGAVSPLAIVPVDWNPNRAPIADVRAVGDGGDVVSVFSTDGASIFSRGSLVAHDSKTRDWTSGGVLPGADGAARWVIGVTQGGRLYRLRGSTSFEDVTPRYGLGTAHVRSSTAIARGVTGLLLDDEVATVEGDRVTRWATPGLHELAGGGGLAAGTLLDAVDVIDARQKVSWKFSLPGVKHVAVDTGGRVYAATDRGLYISDGSRRLRLLYDAGEPRLRGLVASEVAWFLDGEELGVIDRGRVLETSGAHLGSDAALTASPTGDVWVISHGMLARFARARTAGDDLMVRWQREVAPVFGRACATCHLPNGASGIDLSTAERWTEERGRIRERVLEERSMPPRGHELSEVDRAVIARWMK
jgi:mono/diheme cytochrome c family protein